MVSLSRLNAREFKQGQEIASIGPGQVWRDVYHWLAQYGLAVNGGRYPTVGVGGYLVGGGISCFSSTHGWGCDTVIAYEVVLADGSIVEATADGEYADLFWALRGGHNNFGTVTRFDLETFAMTSAYFGGTIWDGNNASAQTQFFSALDSYMIPGGGVDDPNVATSAIVSIANETVVELAFAELANVSGAVAALTYQPISRDWLVASQRSGGNVIGLDPDSGTFIVNSFVEKAGSIIIEETTKLGLSHDFIYLNDASPTQRPFETYGGGKSLARLTQIRDKYDPDGFLQKCLAHGFGIP
ncbi:hypothetical protein INS49_005592 [Diaporthe citri]|uniref:uncharacterized protein n=1 Tax=Diaporthe citri TaxID=83186 RepID=UPI001C7F68EE|nr:uncharacterized protein INS49_005592 [Diaporthe citri]KAG6353411.1 hypothetical protein INS49_005592 [Diaporthe citri]